MVFVLAPLCAACAAFVIVEDIFPIWGGSSRRPLRAFFVSAPLLRSHFWCLERFPCAGDADCGFAAEHSRSVAWQATVFFSDAHLGMFAERLCKEDREKIQAQGPLVVAIVGDLFDGVKCDAKELIAPFKDCVRHAASIS